VISSQTNERRWSERYTSQLRVDVYQKQIRITSAVLCNIGLGGLFIQSDSVLQNLDCGQALKLCISHPANTQNDCESALFPATIIRQEKAGTGLVFSDVDVCLFQSLRELLRVV